MKEFLTNIKFVWAYTKGQRLKILCVSILNIVGVFLSVVSPIIGAKVIMNITNENLSQLFLMAIFMLILGIVENLQMFLAQTCSYISFRETFNNMQINLGENILQLENKVFDENGSGVFMERLTGDTNSLATIFNSLNSNIFGIISKIGIYIAIFYISKTIFFVTIIMVIIRFLIERKRAKLVNEKDKERRKNQEKLSGFVGELVRGARDIKMLNTEKTFTDELEKKASIVNKSEYERSNITNKYYLLRGFVRDSMNLILIVLCVILIKNKILSLASAIIIYNYSFKVSGIAEMAGNLIDRIKNFNLSCSRIIALTSNKEFKKENFGATHLPHINGNFEFKNVHFSYGKEKVLKGINFKVNANETVAFVGKSGAGKTTIFNLLCKMYEPQKGTITIDGKNIKKLDKDTIRGNITIISQNPYIFNMTIRENLNLVKENLTENEMIESCKIACLHDFIMTLENQYDTVIGEGGVNLSGGQKQRLAIARALIQKTEIILFDEATSALDNETQELIQESIENMKGKYTILIIAHRLSTIKNSDKIIFINDGIVEKVGTHKELLKECPNYKNLYKTKIRNEE